MYTGYLMRVDGNVCMCGLPQGLLWGGVCLQGALGGTPVPVSFKGVREWGVVQGQGQSQVRRSSANPPRFGWFVWFGLT